MKVITILCALFFLTSTNNQNENSKDYESNGKLVNIRVPNLAKYSSPVEVYSVFGENAGCKISLFENNTSGKVIIQYSIDNKENWKTLLEGQFIKSQSVWCRVKGLGGSGSVILKIQ